MTKPEPRFVIVAGPNGAGKSTIANAPLAQTLLGDAPAINPDIHARSFLREYSLTPDAANLLAVVQTELEVWRAIAEGRSVAVETVLSTDKYLAAMRAAHSRGFQNVLIYIALPSVEYSVQRVQARVADGGHDVPEASIRKRWPRTLDNFRVFLNEADDVALFSNAGTEPVLVGARTSRGPFQLYYPDELPEISARLNVSG
jgi:predicted ABC-type ATPase